MYEKMHSCRLKVQLTPFNKAAEEISSEILYTILPMLMKDSQTEAGAKD